MYNQSNRAIFGDGAPSKVPAPETLDAGNYSRPIHEGDRVTPRVLVQAIVSDALVKLGGVDWIVKFVGKDDANGRVFLQLVGKLMPLQMHASLAPLTIVIKREDGEQVSPNNPGPMSPRDGGNGTSIIDVSTINRTPGKERDDLDCIAKAESQSASIMKQLMERAIEHEASNGNDEHEERVA